MAATYSEVKVSTAILDYRINWSAWLTAQNNDTISSAAWDVTGATEGTNGNTTTTTTVRVSAGTAGTPATLKCTITTAASRIEVRSIALDIVSSIIAKEIFKAPGATMAVPAPTWSGLNDTISTYTWSAAAGLTIASGGSTATVVISGGTAGVDYALTCAIVTSNAQEDSRVILVQVRER